MQLVASEDEVELESVVRAWADRAWEVATHNAEGQIDRRGWWSRAEREVAIASLLIPESLGGQGAGTREAAAVVRALVHSLVPVPYLHAGAMSSSLLLGVDVDAGLLESVARAERLVVPAFSATDAGPDDALARVKLDLATESVSGSVPLVIAGSEATDLIVAGMDGAEPFLGLVENGAAGLSVTSAVVLDHSRGVADVTLDRVPVQILAKGDTARAALESAFLVARALLCVEQSALARHALETVVAYTSTRRQFGRPVGSFQALKHRMAEVWLATTSAEAAAMAALDAAVRGTEDAGTVTAMAKVFTSDVAVRAAEEMLQLHGGIGMTWESTVHLFLKRAKFNQGMLGTPGRLIDEIADLAGLRLD
jgi:alkylation response protein AidB-like acyl-CoA dehydrogenase